MRLAAILLVASSLLPLLVLARWTFELEPGAGPQGGEVIFLGWFLLAGWLTLITVASSHRLVAAQQRTAARYVLTGVAALGVAVATCVVAFILLNASSFAGTPPVRARQELWGALGLFVALIAANLWVWVR